MCLPSRSSQEKYLNEFGHAHQVGPLIDFVRDNQCLLKRECFDRSARNFEKEMANQSNVFIEVPYFINECLLKTMICLTIPTFVSLRLNMPSELGQIYIACKVLKVFYFMYQIIVIHEEKL